MALEGTLKSLGNSKKGTRRGELSRKYSRITRELDDLAHVMRTIDAIPIAEPVSNATPPPARGKLPSDGIGNAFVAVRDLTIRKYRDLPGKIICTKLDAELLRRAAPPTGFPATWEKYGVHTYLAAYGHRRCRNLVEKMISKAKKRRF